MKERIEELEYKYVHIGDGKFKCIKPNGDVLLLGPNTIGMIRYVFFEDYTLPEVGWSTTQKELLDLYQPKILNDILSGKIKKDENGVFKEGYN